MSFLHSVQKAVALSKSPNALENRHACTLNNDCATETFDTFIDTSSSTHVNPTRPKERETAREVFATLKRSRIPKDGM